MSTTYTHCIGCGRPVRSEQARRTGYGSKCIRQIRRATRTELPDFKPAQLDAARELIEDGGIVATRETRIGLVYRAVSTDGTALHLTTAAGHCTCPAGHQGRRCYHVAAAQMLTLAA
ncbi:hypothetical protein [Streptomyces sp. SID11385]|uniref:hypothetical protein n=1 Tax=Streptomyces sp. SID11385 TaxID=2706031 RepID=UPI0013C6EF94|nr:hypothetical protein [Streptomyces sp. SID11385]NEA42752.1 hypothetical protein [Streptomyces sp. SID11385]